PPRAVDVATQLMSHREPDGNGRASAGLHIRHRVTKRVGINATVSAVRYTDRSFSSASLVRDRVARGESHCPGCRPRLPRWNTAETTKRLTFDGTPPAVHGSPKGRWSGDQRQRESTAQLARRRLGNRTRGQHHHIAWPRRDLGDDLVSNLMLDATHLCGVVDVVRLDRNGKRFA